MRPSVGPLLFALAAALGGSACDGAAGAEPRAAEAASSDAALPEQAARQGTLRVLLRASEDDAPLPGLRVYVWPRPGTGIPLTEIEGSDAVLGQVPTSDAGGAARFTLPPGGYGVDLAWPPAASEAVEVAPGGEAQVVLRRPSVADRAYHVLVRDPSGAPLAGARVEALGTPEGVREAVASARTDADGRAELRVPSWTPLVAAVRADGLGETRLVVTERHPVPERAREVRLEPGAALVGRLVDSAGAPLAGAVVRARASAGELFADGEQPDLRAAGGEAFWRAPTDAAGAFALAVPAEVGLVLEVEREDGTRRSVRELDVLRLAPGETREHVLVASAGTSVRGRVLAPDGAPRAGVAVWLVRGGGRRVFTRFEEVHDRALTDGEGRFAFDDVEPGSWRVGPAPAPPDAGAAETADVAPVPELIEVLEGMPLVEVDLEPPPALFVRGRCVGPEGEPVAGVHVVAGGGGQVATAVTGADGRFRLGPLVEGELALRATPTGSGYASGEPAAVRAGARDVVVRLPRAGRLAGAVLSGGEPVEAEVRVVLRERLRGSGGRRVQTGADGRFDLDGLEPGTYVVVARADPLLVAVAGHVQVGPDAPAAPALELAAGARARFRLPSDHGARFYVVFAAGDPVERGPLEGALERVTEPFPAGEVAIELHGPDGVLLRRTATAAAGTTVDLDFGR